MAIEKFDTLKARPGSGKRLIKSKLLTALGATGVNLPYPQNTERIIERKMILAPTFNPNAASGGLTGLKLGLVSYWKFDEVGPGTRIDSFGPNNLTDKLNDMGSTNPGIINLCTGQFGQTNIGAGLFALDNASLRGNQSFTLAGWSFSTGGATARHTVGKFPAAGAGEYALFTNQSADTFFYYWAAFWDNGVQKNIDGSADSHFREPAGDWKYLAFGYDKPNQLAFLKTVYSAAPPFLVGITVAVSNIVPTALDFVMGNNSSYNFAWWGYLDEWGLWNRVLNDAELRMLWNNNLGLPFSAF